MLVGIISRPSSITSQIPPGTPELWPLNCPKLGFPLSKSKSLHRSLSNLVNMLVGIISWPSSIISQIPSGTPELWPLNCPKTELAVYTFQVEYLAPKNVVITIEFTTNTSGVFCVSLALLLNVLSPTFVLFFHRRSLVTLPIFTLKGPFCVHSKCVGHLCPIDNLISYYNIALIISEKWSRLWEAAEGPVTRWAVGHPELHDDTAATPVPGQGVRRGCRGLQTRHWPPQHRLSTVPRVWKWLP